MAARSAPAGVRAQRYESKTGNLTGVDMDHNIKISYEKFSEINDALTTGVVACKLRADEMGDNKMPSVEALMIEWKHEIEAAQDSLRKLYYNL